MSKELSWEATEVVKVVEAGKQDGLRGCRDLAVCPAHESKSHPTFMMLLLTLRPCHRSCNSHILLFLPLSIIQSRNQWVPIDQTNTTTLSDQGSHHDGLFFFFSFFLQYFLVMQAGEVSVLTLQLVTTYHDQAEYFWYLKSRYTFFIIHPAGFCKSGLFFLG